MPFLNQIAHFINDSLKAGSLNKKKLQPAKYHGLSTVVFKSTTDKSQGNITPLPGTSTPHGKITLLTPDSKYALQVYHKLVNNTYSYEKSSYGDAYNMKCTSEMNLVVFTNSAISGSTHDMLEPIFIFGMPQRLSTALIAGLKINSCLITPLSSNMDQASVFRQEFPRADYFLTDQMGMFLIRYRIEMVFSQACIDDCLNEGSPNYLGTESREFILTEDGKFILIETGS